MIDAYLSQVLVASGGLYADSKYLHVESKEVAKTETGETARIFEQIRSQKIILRILGTVQVIGIMSAPATQTVIYPNGDQIQYFVVEFYSNDFTGELQVHDQQEITSARFLTAENLQRIPLNEQAILESWQHYQTTNKVRLG